MFALLTRDLNQCFGLGVAGNFAGHLEQAGEAVDFANVTAAAPQAPKGIFPFYAPGDESFLGTFPLSHDRIAKPASASPVNLQIEPEAGLLCDVSYSPDGSVARLSAVAIGAFNDCSIRRPNARKISEKKNWGPDSKGVAAAFFAVTDIERGGPTRSLRIACFLGRNGQTRAYGVDSPLSGYSYYGRQLLDWIGERINHQRGAENTPLEDVGGLLAGCGSPERLLIGIGATRYTELGASTYLQAGDQSIVVVYDSDELSPRELERAIERHRDGELVAASILRQTVYDAPG